MPTSRDRDKEEGEPVFESTTIKVTSNVHTSPWGHRANKTVMTVPSAAHVSLVEQFSISMIRQDEERERDKSTVKWKMIFQSAHRLRQEKHTREERVFDGINTCSLVSPICVRGSLSNQISSASTNFAFADKELLLLLTWQVKFGIQEISNWNNRLANYNDKKDKLRNNLHLTSAVVQRSVCGGGDGDGDSVGLIFCRRCVCVRTNKRERERFYRSFSPKHV